MPATSQAQFKAMQAAAHGKSTLGIPAKVGKEFVAGQSPKGLPKHAMHKKGGKLGQRARLAETLKKLHHHVHSGLKKAFPEK